MNSSQFEVPPSLYGKIMKFIKNNKIIPPFVDNEIQHSEKHRQNVEMLEDAIKKGNDKCPIFFEEDCLRYLLYLIKNEKITESEAMTASLYLMAIKSPYKIDVINIHDDESFKTQFINKMIRKSEEAGLSIDKNQINDDISKLQGINAWIMIATPKDSPENSDTLLSDGSLLVQINSMPYMDYDLQHCIFSSVGIMNALLTQINPLPILYFLMLGIISIDTLKMIHTLGFHPIELHGGKFVTKNLEFAHDLHLSPLVMMLHDFYHIYSGTLLKRSDHNYLFNTIIPILDKIINILNNNHKIKPSPLAKQLQILSEKLTDMDVAIFANGNLLTPDQNGKRKAAESDFFQSWLIDKIYEDIFYKNAEEIDDFSPYALPLESLEKFPYLPDVVRFYFELSKLVNIEEDEFIFNIFGGLHPLVASKVIELACVNNANFPIQFNSNLIEKIYDENNETAMNKESLNQFYTLLKSCSSVSEFNDKILNEDYSTLYFELIQAGFPYSPETIIINDNDFQNMKKIIFSYLQKNNLLNGFGLFNNHFQSFERDPNVNVSSTIPTINNNHFNT